MIIVKKYFAAAVVAGSVLTMVTAPVVANAAGSSVTQPAETIAEQVKRIHEAGIQAHRDAETAKSGIESAVTRAQMLAAVASAAHVRETGKRIDREAEALLDTNDPALYENHSALRVSLVQGLAGAQYAVKITDQAVATLVGWIHEQGAQAERDAEAVKAAAVSATTPAQAQTALDTAAKVRATGQGIDDKGQGLLDSNYPTLTDNRGDLAVSAGQGMARAERAVKIADEAIAIAKPKLTAPATEVPGQPTTAAPSNTPADAPAASTGPQVKVKPKGGVETGGGATARG